MTAPKTAVPFAGALRLHVALEVADLDRSIAFYRALFDRAPSKLRPGYAKFEPTDPPVNLALNAGRGRPLEGAAHLGVEVRSSAAVAAAAARLRAAGLAVRVEEQVACCYAVQDKVWVTDPDGNPWEVFAVTDADAPQRTSAEAACCVPGAGDPARGAGRRAAEPARAADGATEEPCCEPARAADGGAAAPCCEPARDGAVAEGACCGGG